MDKQAWRRQILADRAGTTIDPSGHVAALAPFLAATVAIGRWVVVYDALPGEVALDELLRTHGAPDRRFALTRTPEKGHRLTIHPVGGPTERHRYGYRQPMADGPVVEDADLGAVLVPGIAFDRAGNRLGRGGGYYDRFLARLDPSVLRIGMVTGPLIARLPTEAHDVTMTHLALADGVVEVPVA